MAKVSKESVSTVVDLGFAEDRSEATEGYTFNFVSIRETHDMTEVFSALPGGSCPCPHWGYVSTGRMTIRYDDGREEVVEAGDAYYLQPGHVPAFEAGTELLIISPSKEYDELEAAFAQLQGPAGE